MKRREFIEIVASCAAVSAAAWPSASSAPGAASASSAGARPVAPRSAATYPARIDIVIYDARYPDAERFASALTREGARALATAGELVTMWRDEIATRLDVESLWIAGLTLHSDFEIARQLAAAHGLRVFHRQANAARSQDATRTRPGALTSWLLG